MYERYIQDLTNNAIYPDSVYQYIPEFKFGKQEKRSSDAYIRCGKNLLIVEAKGYSILINSLVKNEDITKNNDKLYVKPILQADQRFCEIEQQMDIFDGIETVYIVSVTMESVSAVPEYLKEIHEKILDKRQSKKLKYFLNLNIEEYEMLMYLVERQKDAFSVLKEYFERRNIIPFVTYLNHKAKGKVLRTSFMTSLYNEATTGLKNMYDFKDKNS